MSRKIRINKSKKSAVIISDSDLTIGVVAEIKNELLDLFAKVKRIEFDLKDAESIDVAFLQLLCSAHNFAVSESKEFVLKRPIPDGIQAIIRESGFWRSTGCCDDRENSCLWLTEAVNE